MSAFTGGGILGSSGVGAGLGAYIELIPGASLIPGLSSLTGDFTIQLGDLTLQDFEEPSDIDGGTDQTTAPHEYPGGVRTIDTFGAKPEDEVFSGRMMGPTAEQRVQALETIVQQGLAVNFTYSQRQFLVILKNLKRKFYNYYDIEYTLTIEIIVDYGLTNPASLSTELDNIFSADISSASASVASFVGGMF